MMVFLYTKNENNKCRAQRIDNGERIEGYYYLDISRNSFSKENEILWKKHFIRKADGVFDNLFKAVEVDYDTIGQFAGVNKKGKEFYEGMIVGMDYDDGEGVSYLGEIQWMTNVLGWCINEDMNLSDYIESIVCV